MFEPDVNKYRYNVVH